MDKFDEKLYHLLGEYYPEYKDKKLSKKAKHTYISILDLYLEIFNTDKDLHNINWYEVFVGKLIGVGVEKDFADVLSLIRDDWELADLKGGIE